MRMTGRFLAILCLGATLAGCAKGGPPSASSLHFERQQSVKLVSEMKRKKALIEDRQLNAYMGQIVRRISKGRAPGLPRIRAYIVKDPDVNAFTTGGGYVFVNAGLIAAMENEAQLAMVVSHEIGHIDRGHVEGGRQNKTAVGLLSAIASIGASAAGVGGRLTNLGIGLAGKAAVSTYSRSQESDADQVGLAYLSAGGYSGREGIKSFQVLRRVHGRQGGGVASFFSSHPLSTERQAALSRMIARKSGGRVAEKEYLRKTHVLRVEVKKYLDANGRKRESNQLRRNIARTR